MNIGIVILATNAYFPLGVRLVKRFNHFYKGENEVKYFVFTDTNPDEYLPKSVAFEWIELRNSNWVEGTNAKFTSILSLESSGMDYIFYIDADTNILQDFGDWFLGDLVGGQHYGDQTYMKEEKPYERNPKSMAYIPKTTSLPQMYYYGAFWGGIKSKVMDFCRTMVEWQNMDREWGFNPVWDDESFSNKYFHYNPPTKVVLASDFPFAVSDKGGIENTRYASLDITKLKSDLQYYKNELIDIRNGKVICISRDI